MAAWPGIQVELEVSNTVSNLLQRDADVAVRLFRPAQNDLVARKITDLPLGLYAHRDYLARNPPPDGLQDLAAHRIVGFDREGSRLDAGRMLGVAFTKTDFDFRCDNILTHIAAIRAGLGIGVTHQGLARAWAGVERVLPDVALPGLELWIACHSDVRYNKRVRLMMDFLAEKLQNPYKFYRC
jgi:DNA-binding transcriptional LysR family regulator